MWRKGFHDEGPDGLKDRPLTGQPRAFPLVRFLQPGRELRRSCPGSGNYYAQSECYTSMRLGPRRRPPGLRPRRQRRVPDRDAHRRRTSKDIDAGQVLPPRRPEGPDLGAAMADTLHRRPSPGSCLRGSPDTITSTPTS
jgi:hypothetical protein